jgi:NAD(P)H dehydrogenase (quinone)
MNEILVIRNQNGSVVTKMAKAIATEAEKAGGNAVEIDPGDISERALLDASALVIGTACHMGGVEEKVKKVLDSTYALRGKLEGKIGAAFATGRFVGGGAEFALLNIYLAFLLHGMIIQGDSQAAPFGPVIVNPTGEIAELITDDWLQCGRLGRRVAELVRRTSA